MKNILIEQNIHWQNKLYTSVKRKLLDKLIIEFQTILLKLGVIPSFLITLMINIFFTNLQEYQSL